MIAHPCPSQPCGAALTQRRGLLVRAAALLAGAVAWPAQARVSDWLPYRPDQVRRLEPRLSGGMDHAAVSSRTLRIDPVITDFEPAGARPAVHRPGKASATSATASGLQPPGAYVRIARQYGVDPWLLYGVALQESQLKFGARTLPYPWTLCVRGKGLRYAGYGETLAALKGYVGRGVTNVDCGAMQVNWRWHADRLGSFERALDPYPNLSVGAQILRGHYDARGDWRGAIALYHTGSDATAEARQRGERYAAQTLARLERLGVRHAAAIAGGRHG
ncbi:transglycosylase SLT domain-containing protein [Diaphorobacter sp. C33]|uniref:Transglycosylase-like protein with SLT domain n=1 Tax=Diaphorobacter nitroreducens TaxID=164759 RepID=A0AAX1WRE4_9BURK|nr:transglycosylase SLT domain-containing protein [Diaphorobacter sp. C33]ROR39684.1 transglycosylase-like protein with SLT domain [Diaphorobacter nitroreducens]WKK90584.1 transglycosylase SLT domain-containing protein [Diaphorobacter sp. C33]